LNWFYLAMAILAEIGATSALKSTEGFSKLVPSALTVIGLLSTPVGGGDAYHTRKSVLNLNEAGGRQSLPPLPSGLAEIGATSALKSTEGFSKLVPSALTVIGYGAAFFFWRRRIPHPEIGVEPQRSRRTAVAAAPPLWAQVGYVNRAAARRAPPWRS
jgi:multidrug transporter EmrE-like cation transporter